MRGVVLVVATIATAIAAVVAVDRLDVTFDALRWWPLLLATLVLTPLLIAANAAELRATAMASGATLDEVGWARSLRVVVLATAANLLPVPAGAVLRVQVLRDAGARLTAAAGVQLSAAGVWIGASLALAGLALLASLPTVGAAALAGGLALVGVGLLSVRRTATARPGAAAGWLGLVELATAVIAAVRLWLVLLGLGLTATTIAQAAVVATAAPLAAAAGFFPGGIGLAELLSAVVAPLADLEPAAGLLAVAATRVLGLVVTVPVAFVLGLRDLVVRADDEVTGPPLV